MRILDAHKLVLTNPTKVRLTLIEQELQSESHNVIATIEGTDKKNEVIAFTAHYDSVRFSTGAYDNGTGSTTILELFNYFMDHKPSRTLKFIWCGSEEMGLLGSKAYVKTHEAELKDYVLNINVDMTGVVLGYDIACCTTENSGVEIVNALGKEIGFAIRAKQGVYSSDSTPFADKCVPAISFARISPMGGARIHSRLDVIDFLDEDNYYKNLWIY
ncbi:MAG: M28 family metallopeptidase [Clostridium sp.]|nr:MAG: M28 family metallopeptidase [Clostridium sp.]